MYKLKDYDPPKPFFKMSIDELVKYNDKCVMMDLYNKNPIKKRRKTRNRRNRKTKRRRKTKKFLSKKIKLKVLN
jgi:hypothetical protein